MARPWNCAAFPKEEHKLLDIISEELSKRLQIEDDFVWITKSDSVLSDSDIVPFTNIVQYVKLEVGNTDKTYDSDDSGVNQLNVDEYFDDFYHKRPANMVKCAHKPQRMKCKELKTLRRHDISHQADLSIARYSDNSKTQKFKETSLLPTIDFGEATNALLKRIIDQRYMGRYSHVLGKGKNSVVLHAYCHRNNCIAITYLNAVKVYKLSNNDDANMSIYKRVKREFDHMNIVHNKLGACPWPIRAWDNIILMAFIGDNDSCVSPSIKDISPTEEMYWKIVSYIDEFYNKLHLVHGKLCARNIRWDNSLQFIGWGHSVKRSHPLALLKLIKDCNYVTKFYTQRGFKLQTTEDLFIKITGKTKINNKLLDVIKKNNLFTKYDENPNRSYSSTIKPSSSLRFKYC